MLHIYNFFSVFSLFYNVPSHVSRGQPKWLSFANNAAKAVCTMHNSETKGLWIKLTSKVSGCYKVIHQTAITSIMLQYYNIWFRGSGGRISQTVWSHPHKISWRFRLLVFIFWVDTDHFLMISTCFCLFLCNFFS